MIDLLFGGYIGISLCVIIVFYILFYPFFKAYNREEKFDFKSRTDNLNISFEDFALLKESYLPEIEINGKLIILGYIKNFTGMSVYYDGALYIQKTSDTIYKEEFEKAVSYANMIKGFLEKSFLYNDLEKEKIYLNII